MSNPTFEALKKGLTAPRTYDFLVKGGFIPIGVEPDGFLLLGRAPGSYPASQIQIAYSERDRVIKEAQTMDPVAAQSVRKLLSITKDELSKSGACEEYIKWLNQGKKKPDPVPPQPSPTGTNPPPTLTGHSSGIAYAIWAGLLVGISYLTPPVVGWLLIGLVLLASFGGLMMSKEVLPSKHFVGVAALIGAFGAYHLLKPTTQVAALPQRPPEVARALEADTQVSEGKRELDAKASYLTEKDRIFNAYQTWLTYVNRKKSASDRVAALKNCREALSTLEALESSQALKGDDAIKMRSDMLVAAVLLGRDTDKLRSRLRQSLPRVVDRKVRKTIQNTLTSIERALKESPATRGKTSDLWAWKQPTGN